MDDDDDRSECRARLSPQLSTATQALLLLLRFIATGFSSAFGEEVGRRLTELLVVRVVVVDSRLIQQSRNQLIDVWGNA
jgi:hypothetical protein